MSNERWLGAQVTHVTYHGYLGIGLVVRIHPGNDRYVYVRWTNGWTYIEMVDHLRLAGY